VRISPRKVKVVLDLIRGKDTDTAMAILKNTNKAASEHLIKLLKSATANAEHNFHMDASNLYVSECFVCPGPTLKSIMPRAKGSVERILNRTSHVTMTVKERD
jgi:large subunit ribosomal protein L22